MKNLSTLAFSLLVTITLGLSSAVADELVQTGVPGSDIKALLDHKSDEERNAGGAIIRDKECAKKTMKGKNLNSNASNADYEKCVKDKLESTKKKGDH